MSAYLAISNNISNFLASDRLSLQSQSSKGTCVQIDSTVYFCILYSVPTFVVTLHFKVSMCADGYHEVILIFRSHFPTDSWKM